MAKFVLTTVSNHLTHNSMLYDTKEQAMNVMDTEYKDELRGYEEDSGLVVETYSSRLFSDRMQNPYRMIKTIDIKTGETNIYEWFVSTLIPNGLDDQDYIFGGNDMNTTTNNTSILVTPDVMAIRYFNDEQKVNNWLRNFDEFTVADDGTITCKASEEALKLAETQSLAVALFWEDGLEAILVGEDGCLNNFDMYTPIFLSRFNCEYLIPYSTSDSFADGETVVLYPKVDLTKEELDEDLEWAENH